ncbi:MAG: hypothetical protein CL862_11075 [Cyanobium sp. NAT70]|nr:hypothetical protein [Cyanobium sp. NAT70]|tara:strand:+ start:1870 stop:3006 length:1137 start_codon:yes stop_codon:yes gene_type:complete
MAPDQKKPRAVDGAQALMDLDADALGVIASSLRRRYRFMFRLTCRTAYRLYNKKTRTPLTSVCGSVTMLTWARTVGVPWTSAICTAAARRGAFAVMKWAHEHGGLAYEKKTAEYAAKRGDARVMQSLREARCAFDMNDCLKAAASAGNYSTTKWICDLTADDVDVCLGEAWAEAVESAPISYLASFLEHIGDIPNETLYLAACYGRCDVFEWACTVHSTRGSRPVDPFDYFAGYDNVCDVASEAGHFEVLKAAMRRGWEWTHATVVHVAAAGRLDLLTVLYDMEFTYPHDPEHECNDWSDAIHFAATGGHVDVLRYLHAKGIPWTELTCSLAANRNHLHALKYLHENGCPWDYRVREFAMSADIIAYLDEHNAPHRGP